MQDNAQRTWARSFADDLMTFRVYVRWPGQRVSDKTTTDSRRIAEIAFDELKGRAELAREGALGVALTLDRKQVAYHGFGPTEPQGDGAGSA